MELGKASRKPSIQRRRKNFSLALARSAGRSSISVLRILKIGLISDDALNTSEIEGEVLNRERPILFASDPEQQRIPPAERGVAEMMVNLYETLPRRLA